MDTMTMLKKLALIMSSKAQCQAVELDERIKGFDGIGNNSKKHYVIRAMIKSTRAQNIISFYPVEQEFRVFIPYVSDGEKFKKLYGFDMLGIASEGSTKDRVWVRIEGKYFQPLFELGGDSRQILKFLCAVNPYYIPPLENTDESINEIRAALGLEKIETVVEGTSRYSIHKSRERDQRIVQLKLQEASENNIHLTCEVCGLSMKTIYGSYGENVCEVHHRTPLFLLHDDESTDTSLDDLAILCPNCHRVIHRDKENPITVDQLREIVQQNRISAKAL